MSKKENAAEETAGIVRKDAEKVAEMTPSAPKGKEGPFLYIGPNRMKDGLRSRQIFKTMPTTLIQSVADKFPSVGRLFVSAGSLSAAMDAVKRKGTPLYLAYQEVLGVHE